MASRRAKLESQRLKKQKLKLENLQHELKLLSMDKQPTRPIVEKQASPSRKRLTIAPVSPIGSTFPSRGKSNQQEEQVILELRRNIAAITRLNQRVAWQLQVEDTIPQDEEMVEKEMDTMKEIKQNAVNVEHVQKKTFEVVDKVNEDEIKEDDIWRDRLEKVENEKRDLEYRLNDYKLRFDSGKKNKDVLLEHLKQNRKREESMSKQLTRLKQEQEMVMQAKNSYFTKMNETNELQRRLKDTQESRQRYVQEMMQQRQEEWVKQLNNVNKQHAVEMDQKKMEMDKLNALKRERDRTIHGLNEQVDQINMQLTSVKEELSNTLDKLSTEKIQVKQHEIQLEALQRNLKQQNDVNAAHLHAIAELRIHLQNIETKKKQFQVEYITEKQNAKTLLAQVDAQKVTIYQLESRQKDDAKKLQMLQHDIDKAQNAVRSAQAAQELYMEEAKVEKQQYLDELTLERENMQLEIQTAKVKMEEKLEDAVVAYQLEQRSLIENHTEEKRNLVCQKQQFEFQIMNLSSENAVLTAKNKQHLKEQEENQEQQVLLTKTQKELLQAIDKLRTVEAASETSFTCFRCMNILSKPVTLIPCGHSFCQRCIMTEAQAQDESNTMSLSCKECTELSQTVYSNKMLDDMSARFSFRQQSLQGLFSLCTKLTLNKRMVIFS